VYYQCVNDRMKVFLRFGSADSSSLSQKNGLSCRQTSTGTINLVKRVIPGDNLCVRVRVRVHVRVCVRTLA